MFHGSVARMPLVVDTATGRGCSPVMQKLWMADWLLNMACGLAAWPFVRSSFKCTRCAFEEMTGVGWMSRAPCYTKVLACWVCCFGSLPLLGHPGKGNCQAPTRAARSLLSSEGGQKL
eukprot:1140087-Pelagomonas_calceolata.AAC.3